MSLLVRLLHIGEGGRLAVGCEHLALHDALVLLVEAVGEEGTQTEHDGADDEGHCPREYQHERVHEVLHVRKRDVHVRRVH